MVGPDTAEWESHKKQIHCARTCHLGRFLSLPLSHVVPGAMMIRKDTSLDHPASASRNRHHFINPGTRGEGGEQTTLRGDSEVTGWPVGTWSSSAVDGVVRSVLFLWCRLNIRQGGTCAKTKCRMDLGPQKKKKKGQVLR